MTKGEVSWEATVTEGMCDFFLTVTSSAPSELRVIS